MKTDTLQIILPNADFPPLSRKKRHGEVLFALVNSSNEIWLQRKTTYPDGTFRLPGGGIDEGESSLEALHRELAEETGIRNASPILLGRISYVTPDGSTVDFYSDLYLIESGDSVPVTEDKHEKVAAWLPCPIRELEDHEKALLNLAEPLVSWGLFRSAALSFLRKHLEKRD